jgi:cell division protein ZapA (FtsZ GTPase activity inhibitor)
MQNLIPISLLIGDRTYRIKIEAGEEESIRNMAKKLNDQIAGFKLQYGGKDMQDYLAMVLLSIVTDKKPTATEPDFIAFLPLLEKLEAQLDKGLAD